MPRLPVPRGAALLIAIVLIVGVALLAVAMSRLIVSETASSADSSTAAQALFLADSGVESGIKALLAPAISQRLACGSDILGNPALTNASLGNGRYTLTWAGPVYAASARIQGALAAGDTVIPVNSTAGYDARGHVVVDRERIDYNGITADGFLNAARGADGTAASAHAGNTPVGQYQCDLGATGGVPDLAAGSTQRLVQAGVQLEEGWTAGTGGAIARWNGVAWATAASPATSTLYGVSMLSYADGRMVGASTGATANDWVLLSWNGTAWSRTSSTTPGMSARNLNAVYMVSATDGWAVGAAGSAGQRPMILWTNGSSWTLRNNGVVINSTLNAVHCVTTNDCWTVGVRTAANNNGWLFLHWNGSAWSRTNSTSPNISAQNLTGIYCSATNDCWAVGNPGTGAPQNPMILWWNGTAWTGRNSNLNIAQTLNAVYCVATNDCWAVGNPGTGASQNPLILWWNGTTWATRNSNLNIAQALYGIHCLASNNCWAVGNAGTRLHWDGSAWSAATVPAIAQALRGISLVGPRQQPQTVWGETFQ